MPAFGEPVDIATSDLPGDEDFYHDKGGNALLMSGIRLTRKLSAWPRNWHLAAVDIPMPLDVLERHRIAWDAEHESFDMPVALVNSSARTLIRDDPQELNRLLTIPEWRDVERQQNEHRLHWIRLLEQRSSQRQCDYQRMGAVSRQHPAPDTEALAQANAIVITTRISGDPFGDPAGRLDVESWVLCDACRGDLREWYDGDSRVLQFVVFAYRVQAATGRP
jgi:hypothetical protein